jgi:uncharacterized membrane protein
MNGFQPFQAFRRRILAAVQDVLKGRFFHDRLSMATLTLAVGVNVATVIALVMRVRPTDSLVPVHFSSFTLFDQLGPWYYPFEIAAVALMVSIVNTVFSYHSYTRSRLASFFLLVTALVVAIFSFIIAQAFGAVR